MRRYSLWCRIILASLTLSSCANDPITVPDVVVCGWIGAVGGTNNACECVHTVDTTISPQHYSLDQCLQLLNGSVFTQGSNFNMLQTIIDTQCTEDDNCTYGATMSQIRKILPKGK